MTTIIPALQGKEKETLYIIGNGFDLHHGVLSKYKHFYCWLNINGYEQYADDLQNLFPKLNNNPAFLWSNFEDALGEYELAKITKQYLRLPENLTDAEQWKKVIDSAVDSVTRISGKIEPLLKEWACRINIDNIHQLYNFSNDSYYLTFNYTMLLERIYGIPEQQICHIHGSVEDNGRLIFGHNIPRADVDLPAEYDEEENTQRIIIKELNKLAKPKEEQIRKNINFFNSLSKISRVVVIGHSLADVDLLYYGEILKRIRKDAFWYFSKPIDNDLSRIQRLVRPYSTSPKKIHNSEIFNL